MPGSDSTLHTVPAAHLAQQLGAQVVLVVAPTQAALLAQRLQGSRVQGRRGRQGRPAKLLGLPNRAGACRHPSPSNPVGHCIIARCTLRSKYSTSSSRSRIIRLCSSASLSPLPGQPPRASPAGAAGRSTVLPVRLHSARSQEVCTRTLPSERAPAAPETMLCRRPRPKWWRQGAASQHAWAPGGPATTVAHAKRSFDDILEIRILQKTR